ncbi:hypothetical protein BASA81_000508 [Batrachochytrium salamandrivorans]|nr:hypothetical protein BASA81_000508 [Batrachochytrium salamandrivorans]
MTSIRVHVRGWTLPVTEEDIRKRFVGVFSGAAVSEVVMSKKNFAHVGIQLTENATPEQFMLKLKQTYKNAKWKGGVLQFELAEPDFRKRLETEWIANAEAAALAELNRPLHLGLAKEAEAGLRIRRRKGEQIELKKPRIESFPEPTLEELDAKVEYCQFSQLPASQDPSFCCSTGDAGPTPVVASAPEEPTLLLSKPALPPSELALPPSEPVLPPSELSLFAIERLKEIKPPSKLAKDSKYSLLGQWLIKSKALLSAAAVAV